MRRRRPAVDTHERLSDQRDPVQLAIEIGLEDVGRRQVRGRAVVPERDVAGIPLETDRVFRPRHVLPDQFEQLLAFPWCQPDDRLDVGGAREQHALTGLGVHRHERVLAGQRAALDTLVVLLPGLGVRTRDVSVNRAQRVDKAAHRRRQPLIGGNEVGPERVAAIGRDRHAAQDRGERWVDRRRNVGVPARPRRHHHRFSVLVGGAVLGDRVDLGIALDVAEHRMPDGRLAELARHRDMLSVIEVLAAEEYHLPFQEGVTHFLHLFRRQGLAEIDAADFRADMQRQRDDLDIGVRAGALLC